MAAISRTSLWFSSRRGRVVRENLTAYLFLCPAMALIFIFGIFPVGFAFYVSLHRWRRFPGDYQGLDNYTRALGGFAYVVFFWLALAALVYAFTVLRQLLRDESIPAEASSPRWRRLLYFAPGVTITAFLLSFINWFALLLPVVLNIPQRIRGQERVTGLFVNEFFASFQAPEVLSASQSMLLGAAAGLATCLIWLRWVQTGDNLKMLVRATVIIFSLAVAALVLQLTLTEIQSAVEAARADGLELPLWTQVILISAGAGLLAAAYILWRRAARSERGTLVQALAAIVFMLGGYLLVVQLPQALVEADSEMIRGYSVTIMFVLGTVPAQLGIGLVLAYLLFQNIRGKAFFRMMYFLPYITPFVATSIVFGILFSHRPTSPANQFLASLGIPVQKWLLEPTGIIELIFGPQIPAWLAGPSLALLVIIIYTTWTYIGYTTVVYLAGLGNISNELYEAARIDGATEGAIFRHITLPLLSPTTFFLALIAIIGTFQAFTQIWILRTPAAARAVDTVGVYIFETVRNTDPNMGYASAMSMVLFVVILALTLVQNRIAGKRVFYG